MATRKKSTKKTGAKKRMGTAENKMRIKLAACYRMFVRRGMDDLIYTHLSARIPGKEEHYLFIGFGMLFDDVTASNLLKIDIEGNNIGHVPGEVNPAGWIVHAFLGPSLRG